MGSEISEATNEDCYNDINDDAEVGSNEAKVSGDPICNLRDR